MTQADRLTVLSVCSFYKYFISCHQTTSWRVHKHSVFQKPQPRCFLTWILRTCHLKRRLHICVRKQGGLLFFFFRSCPPSSSWRFWHYITFWLSNAQIVRAFLTKPDSQGKKFTNPSLLVTICPLTFYRFNCNPLVHSMPVADVKFRWTEAHDADFTARFLKQLLLASHNAGWDWLTYQLVCPCKQVRQWCSFSWCFCCRHFYALVVTWCLVSRWLVLFSETVARF